MSSSNDDDDENVNKKNWCYATAGNYTKANKIDPRDCKSKCCVNHPDAGGKQICGTKSECTTGITIFIIIACILFLNCVAQIIFKKSKCRPKKRNSENHIELQENTDINFKNNQLNNSTEEMSNTNLNMKKATAAAEEEDKPPDWE